MWRSLRLQLFYPELVNLADFAGDRISPKESSPLKGIPMAAKSYLWSALAALMLWHACSAQQANVSFRVLAPATTPKDAQVYVTGNHPEIGNWNPQGKSLVRENDSVWTATARVPENFRLEFKITLGSWNRQAIYLEHEIPRNTVVELQGDTTLTISPIGWSQDFVPKGGGITGTVRYHRGLTAQGLKFARDIIVWLPPSYEKEPSKRYPVLYMHDGQNIVDPATSFLGFDWRMDEVADSLIRAGAMREIIIVGIYNSPDRGPEYSNTELGKAYARFVVNRVKPLIDSTYRTKPDRLNTATMGSSMGAHISFLLTWWYPDVFSRAGCLSAAFYSPVLDTSGNELRMDDRTIREVESFRGPKKEVRIYLDCGTVSLDAQLRPHVDQMREVLEKIGYQRGKDLEYFIAENADHSEYAWSARVWRPLLFMFRK